MTTNAVYTSASSDAVIRQALSALPEAARRGGPIADAMMTRAGMALLGRIKQAFIAKARGGTDEAGDRWKPLKKETIAYSRRHRKKEGNPQDSRVFSQAKSKPWIPRSNKRAKYGPSYALTKRQNERWWEVYRRQLAIYKGNRGHAAAVAWIILKGEGATTLMEQYGNMQVDILRDTGLLLNSISPGVASPNRVFRVGLGEVIVGTNRKWAKLHHEGGKRVPQRRLWPEVNRWPQSWWIDILEQINSGMMDLAVFLIKNSVA